MRVEILCNVEEGTIVSFQDGTLASVVQKDDSVVTLAEATIQDDFVDEVPAVFYMLPETVVYTL